MQHPATSKPAARPPAALRALSALTATTSLSCSLWLDPLPTGQCSTDADCAHVGTDSSPPLVCDPTWLVCVPPASTARFAAAGAECRASEAAGPEECAAGGCAAPLSPDCSCLEGAWDDPDALVIGSIAPQTFATPDQSTLQLPYVARWEKNVGLAFAELARELPGGRLSHSERRLALLRCNSNNEPFLARRAMQHLLSAGAPIVITLTDSDTAAVRHLAARAETPLVCSSCYAPPETTRETTRDENLVWPIAPALVQQAPLAAWRVAELAAEARARGERSTVVTLSQRYPGIDELMNELKERLLAQGTRPELSIETRRGDGVHPLEVAAAIIEARPRIIAVGMDTDFTTYYLRLIEGGWPAGEPRPHYVLTSMNQELGLLSASVGADDELRTRISGTGFWPGPQPSTNLLALEERFFARHHESIDQAHFGYDAVYAAAYAIAWADPGVALAGPGVARGFDHLRAGTPIDVGPFGVRMAVAQLNAGNDIDLVGTSSALDWDASTHATHSDVTLWCLSRDPDGSLALTRSAGPVWRVDTGAIDGRYACP